MRWPVGCCAKRDLDRETNTLLDSRRRLLVELTSCGGLPTEYGRTDSQVFTQGETTTLGRIFSDNATPTDGSGFALLEGSSESLRARLGLATLVEKSIDTQYFIWNRNAVGRVLGAHLLLAAERGVRVRLLVDDFILGQRDKRITVFNSYPSIEVRLFNPLAGNARASKIGRLLGFAGNFQTLNHRMHNKLFLVGGRNVGDEYYGLSAHHNLRDRDMLATGVVVALLCASFDDFWNSDWAVPFEAVQSARPSSDDWSALIEEMRTFLQQMDSLPIEVNENSEIVKEQFAKAVRELDWADAKLSYDDPHLSNTSAGVKADMVQSRLILLLQSAKREVLIESPYLIPKTPGLAVLRRLVERGNSPDNMIHTDGIH